MKFNAGKCNDFRSASLQCIDKFGGGEAGQKACEDLINKYKDCKKAEAAAKAIERAAAFDEGMGMLIPFQKEIGGFVRGVIGMPKDPPPPPPA
jgi:hypothetical protein